MSGEGGGHVYLVGMPGSGKSTAGRALAKAMGLPFVDLDEEIEREAGTSIEEIFREGGEPAFRDLESGALARAAAGPRSVVSCGGGVPLREENRTVLQSTGTVVALTVPMGWLRARVLLGLGRRPLIKGPVDLDRIHLERESVYREVAHVRVDGRGAPDDVARRIVEALKVST